MKRITQRSAAIAATLTMFLTLASVAIAAPKHDRTSKTITISGRVLKVDQQARTLLVADQWSDKLYLVSVPKGGSFEITFGLYMGVANPELWQTRRNNRVRMRCIRSSDRLAKIDGREVHGMTATR